VASPAASPRKSAGPNSDPTGDTIFVLVDVYESPAAVDEYWRQAIETRLHGVERQGNVSTLHGGRVVQGLW
jgi:hypothetical protein